MSLNACFYQKIIRIMMIIIVLSNFISILYGLISLHYFIPPILIIELS